MAGLRRRAETRSSQWIATCSTADPAAANVEAWQKGYKVVQTVREENRDAGPGKRSTSRAFYRLMQALSDTPITPGAADFQLLDRAALRDL